MKINEIITEGESYQPPELEVGDEILKGKFKNSPAKIKGFTKDKHNQPVLKTNKGDVQLFKPRVVKLKDDSSKTSVAEDQQFIGEVGDTAYDATRDSQSNSTNTRMKNQKIGAPAPSKIERYNFTTKSGINYIIYMYKMKTESGIYGTSITFDMTKNGKPYALTGTGDAIRVFATVKNVLLKYLSKHSNVKFVTFSAKRDEESRVKLYNYIARQFQKWFPGFKEVRTQYLDDYVYFILSKQSIDPRKIRLNEFELPKNQWELVISDGDKEELGTDLVSLVKHAYSNTPQGSFVNSIKDVIPSDWEVIDWDEDPDVDSTVFFRRQRQGESWHGHKIQGIGHDGNKVSKDKAIKKVISMLSKQGVWIESSDAMRAVLKKLNVPVVTDVKFLRALFNDSSLQMIDGDTYVRTLDSGQKIRETVFGRPKLSRQ